jgi:PadR family transcriptional regulator PadR
MIRSGTAELLRWSVARTVPLSLLPSRTTHYAPPRTAHHALRTAHHALRTAHHALRTAHPAPVDSQHLKSVACQLIVTDSKSDVLYGSLGLMILKTLEALGSLHGYRIARRIEQISGNRLVMNQGTLYPALLKLEHAGWITSKWGESDSGRRVKLYALTRAGRKQLSVAEAEWQEATSIVARFLAIHEDPS